MNLLDWLVVAGYMAGMLGLFLLGILTRRANGTGASLGLLLGFGANTVDGYGCLFSIPTQLAAVLYLSGALHRCHDLVLRLAWSCGLIC
ncbi:MAG: hypothetical protein ABR497_11220 [Kiritimatiellia bacterium]|nr:hypothetical protein [Lentisphaerota bacterium]